MQGHADALEMLASAGANLKTPSSSGLAPAHVAAKMNHADVLSVLQKFKSLNPVTSGVWSTLCHLLLSDGVLDKGADIKASLKVVLAAVLQPVGRRRAVAD